MAKVYSCACCGSDVTVPYFFKGAAYGYTCIKRVNPSAKKVKDNGLLTSALCLLIFAVRLNSRRFNVRFFTQP